jgi:hypothetical protein
MWESKKGRVGLRALFDDEKGVSYIVGKGVV